MEVWSKSGASLKQGRGRQVPASVIIRHLQDAVIAGAHATTRIPLPLVGGAAAAWPFAARAQRTAKPVVRFLNGASAENYARFANEFRRGLNEMGFIEGQNVPGIKVPVGGSAITIGCRNCCRRS